MGINPMLEEWNPKSGTASAVGQVTGPKFRHGESGGPNGHLQPCRMDVGPNPGFHWVYQNTTRSFNLQLPTYVGNN